MRKRNFCSLGFLAFLLLDLGQAESLLISGVWVINSTIEIRGLTRNQTQELDTTPPGPVSLPSPPPYNETVLAPPNIIQKFRNAVEVGGRRFQIGTALCIVWVIVGLKIIFCCTIVLTHEPKPKPLIIHHKHLRIQPCPVGNLRIRREEGNLVHLPEEEEVDEENLDMSSKGQRSGEVGPLGQESTTPPPPYSSLRINL